MMLASCSFYGNSSKQPIKVLNNNGGFSHGGLLIKLMDDGSALVTTYSDAIGDSNTTHATYVLDHDLLLLRYRSGGEHKLQKVIYKGQEYWVEPNMISQLTEDSDEGEWQRHTALKPIREQVSGGNGG